MSVKGTYSFVLSSIIYRVARTGLHPNFFSLVSLVPAVLACIAAAMGSFWIAAGMFALSGAMDLIDGALARQTKKVSRFGMLLDSSMDRLSDASVPIGLVVFYSPYTFLAVVPALCLLSGVMISYIRARAQSVDIELPRLWMRRQDRFVVIILALLLSPIQIDGFDFPAPLTLVIFGLLTFAGAIAAAQALFYAARLDD